MSSFLPLEVVGRGSEAQLQVGENLNQITWRVKGQHNPSRGQRPVIFAGIIDKPEK